MLLSCYRDVNRLGSIHILQNPIGGVHMMTMIRPSNTLLSFYIDYITLNEMSKATTNQCNKLEEIHD